MPSLYYCLLFSCFSKKYSKYVIRKCISSGNIKILRTCMFAHTLYWLPVMCFSNCRSYKNRLFRNYILNAKSSGFSCSLLIIIGRNIFLIYYFRFFFLLWYCMSVLYPYLPTCQCFLL